MSWSKANKPYVTLWTIMTMLHTNVVVSAIGLTVTKDM
jgi:hypothetical protein